MEQVKPVAEDLEAQEDPKFLPKEETDLSWGASSKHTSCFTPQSTSLTAPKIQAAAP